MYKDNTDLTKGMIMKKWIIFFICFNANYLLAATITVSDGDDLSQILIDANGGDTILIGPGIYTANTTTENPFFSVFWVNKSLKIEASDPNNPPILRLPSNQNGQVLWLTESDITIENVETQNGHTGIFVQSQNPDIGLAGINLKNINVSTDVSLGGHGIYMDNVVNSSIDSCLINNAGDNGIYIYKSRDIIVMNNQVIHTERQHAIAVQLSSRIDILNNSIKGAAFHGIIILESNNNKVVGNNVSGQKYDGITLSDRKESPGFGSKFNYIAKNIISSNGYMDNPPGDGTGIWLNSESNFNVLYANDISGFPENGLSIWQSSNNYIIANKIYNNFDGGVFFWDPNNADWSTGDIPSNNIIHNNYIFDNISNAQIHLKNAFTAEIAYNFLSGSNINDSSGAIKLGHNGDSTSIARNIWIYQNTFFDFVNGEFFSENILNTSVFRNRHFNVTNIYTTFPADVKWDASVFIGGNYFSNHSALGDPSRTTPYSDIIYNDIGERGIYTDNYPFQTEKLGKPFQIVITEPYDDTILATNTSKSIRWKSKGCTFIDLDYSIGGELYSIIDNYPDVGYFIWKIPSDIISNDYQVVVTCLDSSKKSTNIENAGTFLISKSTLKLLLPTRYQQVNSSDKLRVAWEKENPNSNVEVYIKYDNSVWEFQGITSNNFLDITLPQGLSTSRAKIRIVDASNTNNEDTVDGYFSIRSAQGNNFQIKDANGNKLLSGESILIGEAYKLEWTSPMNTAYVDLSFWDGKKQRVIREGLPDISGYTWFVPEYWTNNSYLIITARDEGGNVLDELQSIFFNIAYSNVSGSLLTRYRLYSEITLEHLFTADINEYNNLGSLNWILEGENHKVYSGMVQRDGVNVIPYYRLYDKSNKQHLWTTDRNEYLTLREYSIWQPEHVDGYIFPNQVLNTVPLYRLVHKTIPIHHWTIDFNEYSTLTSEGGGWNGEGITGYVYN